MSTLVKLLDVNCLLANISLSIEVGKLSDNSNSLN